MTDTQSPRILIIGAGPCGIGAAWRLNELGLDNWLMVEKNTHAGGLASSFVDEHGFVWDIGGHVQFSHYDYFDRVMHCAHRPDQWLTHQRESWIWMADRFVPYPLQYNIGLLPKEQMVECLQGLMKCAESTKQPEVKNFEDWVNVTFGDGLRKHFMQPYNEKVWAYPLKELDSIWIGERVAVPDVNRIMVNVSRGTADCSWGPNNQFMFPRHGGTGSIWTSLAAQLPQEKIIYDCTVTELDTQAKRVTLSNGQCEPYDYVISTMPLHLLLKSVGLERDYSRARFVYSTSNIVGVGLKGAPSEKLRSKCWMYFPEPEVPFYRVTHFSHYSPNNVPGGEYWSLMAEVSESDWKPVYHERLVEHVLEGLQRAKLTTPRDQVVSTWTYRALEGYPTPFLGRDKSMNPILNDLKKLGVYSRGRFGAWKYEVSNQDHTFMQGVEAVENILYGTPELTLGYPNFVNSNRVR